MEQVLFVQKDLDVYRIPPRAGAGGCRSGEWRVNDRIFTGRCRVVATETTLEVRLEDPSSGELFGVAPIAPGQANITVEQAADSSRNFVLRLEDAATKRHAFVGISFADRATAFDFNVAIGDHEKQARRAAEMRQINASDDPLAAANSLMPEAAALYRQSGDLSLKEGETIKISVRKKEATLADNDSFLSRLGPTASSSGGSGSGMPGKLLPLAPPPGQPAMAAVAASFATLAPPPPAAAPSSSMAQSAAAAQQQQRAAAGGVPVDDLLGFGSFGGAVAAPSSSTAAAAPPAAAASNPEPAQEAGWATFD